MMLIELRRISSRMYLCKGVNWGLRLKALKATQRGSLNLSTGVSSFIPSNGRGKGNVRQPGGISVGKKGSPTSATASQRPSSL